MEEEFYIPDITKMTMSDADRELTQESREAENRLFQKVQELQKEKEALLLNLEAEKKKVRNLQELNKLLQEKLITSEQGRVQMTQNVITMVDETIILRKHLLKAEKYHSDRMGDVVKREQFEQKRHLHGLSASASVYEEQINQESESMRSYLRSSLKSAASNSSLCSHYSDKDSKSSKK